MFTARGLIDEARSLADLQNTKFISYTDELRLINEAYRDIYSRYTESDGDYYAVEEIINVTPAMQDPSNPGKAYLVPLPTDFLKIRALSYNYGGQWYPVQKFSISNRDNNPSQPTYRIKNNTLWIVGGINLFAQLKMYYYPIPATITAPDVDVALGSTETVYTLPLINSTDYNQKTGFNIYSTSTAIKSEDVTKGSTVTLLTAATTAVQYYAGYIYYIESGSLKRATTNGVTIGTPATLLAGVTNFSIQKNKIYYSTATETRIANLDGTGSAIILASPTTDYVLVGAHIYYISGGAIVMDGVTTALTASALRTDGVYLFSLDGTVLTRWNDDMTNLFVYPVEAVSIGRYDSGYLPVITDDEWFAISTIPDTEFDYPSNEVNEIMAYTSAIGYARKQSDDKKITLLTARLTELWERFWNVNKRDEYQNTRINNDYQTPMGNW